MKKPPYTVGLLLPAGAVSRQHVRILQDLESLGCPPVVFLAALGRPRGQTLFRLYQALDRRLFRQPADAFAPSAIPGHIASVSLPRADWATALAGAAREKGLDLLVAAGQFGLPPEVAAAFPLGVLTLDHLDPATGGAPRAWAALAGGRPDWEPRLLWQAGGEPPRILYRSPSAVHPLSLGQTAAPACAKAARFVGRGMTALLRSGRPAWETRAEPLPDDRPDPVPDNRSMLRFLPRLLGRHLRAVGRDIACKPQWFLALRRGNGDPFDPWGYSPLFPPGTGGWADPFPFVHQGVVHLFIEAIDAATGLGSIAVMTGQADGSFSPPVPVLKKSCHLSYPFVFAWEGDVFMVPESSGAGAVDLFRATRFPGQWEHVRPLLSGVRAVDATLFPHDGRWWLAANLRQEGASSWDEMSLFYADSPLGEFVPHPSNPVVSDVRRARPAGRVFPRQGRLYRPAQDCSGHYGRGLVFHEILTLTPTEYRETVVARFGAEILGTGDSLHTYNAVPGLETVDGRRFVPRLRLSRAPRTRT